MGSESSLQSDFHSQMGQHFIEVDDENTTDCGYRSEKHRTWTTHSRGGFTTDTGNSDMEIDIASTPRTDGALFSPTDPFAKIDFTSKDVLRNQSESQTQRILTESTPLSPTQVLRTVVDVDVKPNQMIKTKKVTKHYKNADGTTTSEVEDNFQGESMFQSERERRSNVQHNIHRDEHVDTDVQQHQDGDTEVTTVTKTIKRTKVHEIRETYSDYQAQQSSQQQSSQQQSTPRSRHRVKRRSFIPPNDDSESE